MRDGLYKVQFSTPLGVGFGVVYANGGKMWGGDAGIYYLGTYSDVNGDLTATVRIDRHASFPGSMSVFGIDKATINLTGKVQGNSVVADGTSPQAPGVKFKANLSHISD